MRSILLLLGVMALVSTSLARAEAPPVLSNATLGAKAPAGAVVLLGEGPLKGWVRESDRSPASWSWKDGILTVGGGNIMTEQNFGDFELHLEFNIPYMPDAKGQGRGNSGVYLTGNHELQVLDSYGLKSQDNDCGAIYKQVTPAVNACKPPLQWQSYDVIFHKARTEGGKVTHQARVTVLQNGVKIIDNAEVKPTPGGAPIAEGADGPLLLQDHGNPVQYRNIWIKPIH